tara:strand:+ start:146 stop:373 length:228 start_codon:yes stop_codon:yes gene_type:complete
MFDLIDAFLLNIINNKLYFSLKNLICFQLEIIFFIFFIGTNINKEEQTQNTAAKEIQLNNSNLLLIAQIGIKENM